MTRVTESDIVARLDEMASTIQTMGATLTALQSRSIKLDDTQGYRTSEVARKLCLHPQTIYRWIRLGKFPAGIRIGERTIWTEAQLNEWLAERREQSAQQPSHKRAPRTPEQREATRAGVLRYWAMRRAAGKKTKREK
jgi:predicted DNA-binding transcriptional regulator AlpA